MKFYWFPISDLSSPKLNTHKYYKCLFNSIHYRKFKATYTIYYSTKRCYL